MKTSENHATGVPVAALLSRAGIRPTKQRIALGQLLFDGKDRHITAEQLHDAARSHGHTMALATVYNSLHQFTAAGLLRQVVVDATKVYFDTNTGHHHHFFDPGTGSLADVPGEAVRIERLPSPPEGRSIDHVDVIIRLR
ncbi:MAG: iron response transcriptional regulator IrrA [Alphaproteobacteria bacterium]